MFTIYTSVTEVDVFFVHDSFASMRKMACLFLMEISRFFAELDEMLLLNRASKKSRE